MAETPSNQELEARLNRLEAINTALCRISEAVNATTSLRELYAKIHVALSTVVDTTNFYIAIYQKSDDSLSFPYIVDSVDVHYPPVINVSRTASLTADVIRCQEPLLIRKQEILDRRAASGLIIPACTPAEVWLGVPLKTPRDIVGVMTVQNYSNPDCYDQTDMNVMVSVADMVAIAIERKRAEDELRLSEERYRRIITTVNEGILSLDDGNRITFANSHLTGMFGYALGELSGLPFENLLFDEDRQDFVRRQGERQQGKNEQFERRFRTKEGRELWAIVSASPIFGDDGRYLGSFGTITDITDRKKAEMELQEKNLALLEAMQQIKTLRGIVPICMHCKKIRDDSGYWNQVEVFVRDHTEAEFSHGLCPECTAQLYPEYAETDESGDGADMP
jgi:PAS domain S-box-containing protein